MLNRQWMRRLVPSLVCAVWMTVLLSAGAFAQSDKSTIGGFIKDASGAVVPGAKVVLTNEATGENYQATADTQGHYTVPNLTAGSYTLTVEVKGFKKYVSTDNTLSANTTLSLDAPLTIGEATEEVTVSATAQVLQTESAAVQQEITGQQVSDQELNGRNPLYMGSLVPGLRSGSTLGDFNFAVGGGNPYQINGSRVQDTMVTFDGAPAVRTRGNGAIIGVASVDATQEIQVITTDYQAEYGDAAGGQIRMVTKSGTRDFHGSAYEYLRNSAMNANTWVRNQSASTKFAPPYRYNNFGFTFGGPVWIPKIGMDRFRNKFFFFLNEDWIRYRFTDSQTQAVPTLKMRTGDFSEFLSTDPTVNPWFPGHTIYDPATCPKVTSATCVPFMGNVIPSGRLSANGLAILNAYPKPTPGYLNGTQNWIAQAAHPINQRKQVINVDWIINDKHKLEFVRQNATYNEYQPFDQGSGLTGKYFIRPNQTNVLAWTWTISPTMINEARATLSLDNVYIPVNTALAGFNRQTLGITFPYIFPASQKAQPNKIPTASVQDSFYSLAGGPYPSHSDGPIFTASDSLTKVWGSHALKGGYYLNISGENDNDQINVATVPGGSSNQNGTFVFTDNHGGLGATTGASMANLAMGLADNYAEIGQRSQTYWHGFMDEFFVQDSWKVNSKLHLDYGVRISILQPYTPAWGNADYFNPASYNPANAPVVNQFTGNVTLGTGNPYNGMVIPGYSSFPSSAAKHGVLGAEPNPTDCDGSSCAALFAPNLKKGYVNTSHNYQPRIGIAYQLTPNTVVRAGIGNFATRMGLLDNVFPGGNSPFQPTVTVTPASPVSDMVDNPGSSLTTGIAAPILVSTLNQNLKSPQRWNWNVTVERQTPWKSMLTLAYVGGRGLYNWRVVDINQPAVGALAQYPSGTSPNYLRPYRGYAAIQQEQSNGSSRYYSFQLGWNRPFANGFLVGVAYTLAKSMDNSSNYRDILPDSYDTTGLWGPSEYDTRNALVINFLYALPFFKNQNETAGKLLGGWQLSGNMQFQSGVPCGIGTGNDTAGVGEVGSFGCGSEGEFYTLNGTPKLLKQFAGYPGQTGKWFSTINPDGSAIFTPPPANTFVHTPGIRDSVYQPGFQNWNLNMKKMFAINEKTGFEFKVDAYNFINHPNWAGPNLNPTSGTFGRVTSKTTSNPRQLQAGLSYRF
ncbi:MAG TPA: TonB-dependent receptor [Terracidiphilus sp.]|nr:TonB-dependent receptor [Terracidiphilus sp.]